MNIYDMTSKCSIHIQYMHSIVSDMLMKVWHDHDSVTSACSSAYTTKNDLLMQMEYQRKKESSELQQTQRELDMAKVNVTCVQTHTMAYVCTHMHACRDTPTT